MRMFALFCFLATWIGPVGGTGPLPCGAGTQQNISSICTGTPPSPPPTPTPGPSAPSNTIHHIPQWSNDDAQNGGFNVPASQVQLYVNFVETQLQSGQGKAYLDCSPASTTGCYFVEHYQINGFNDGPDCGTVKNNPYDAYWNLVGVDGTNPGFTESVAALHAPGGGASISTRIDKGAPFGSTGCFTSGATDVFFPQVGVTAVQTEIYKCLQGTGLGCDPSFNDAFFTFWDNCETTLKDLGAFYTSSLEGVNDANYPAGKTIDSERKKLADNAVHATCVANPTNCIYAGQAWHIWCNQVEEGAVNFNVAPRQTDQIPGGQNGSANMWGIQQENGIQCNGGGTPFCGNKFSYALNSGSQVLYGATPAHWKEHNSNQYPNDPTTLAADETTFFAFYWLVFDASTFDPLANLTYMDFQVGSNNHDVNVLSAWPLAGIWPTKPLETMAPYTVAATNNKKGSGCAPGDLPSDHGAIDLFVAGTNGLTNTPGQRCGGVYARRYSACFQQQSNVWVNVGPCVALLNSTQFTSGGVSRSGVAVGCSTTVGQNVADFSIYHHHVTLTGATPGTATPGPMALGNFAPGTSDGIYSRANGYQDVNVAGASWSCGSTLVPSQAGDLVFQ